MTLLRTVTLLAAVFFLAGGLASGQNQRPRPAQPAFRPIEDDPKLPRVLLIGDSISIGYTLPVRELLKGKANVHRPPTNCGPTPNGLKNLDAWLGDKKWDVVHFNWGLHDLRFVDDKGATVAPDKGKHQVPLEQYETNLRALVGRLKKTGAALIWCTTTPVPEGATGRRAGDEVRYNEVAAKVMMDNGVAVNDLGAFAKGKRAQVQLPRNVHFTEAGSKELAAQVASTVEKALAR